MDDVASVNVLKGPAATALYGARGGNGAIIITSKGGTGEHSRNNVSHTLAWTKPISATICRMNMAVVIWELMQKCLYSNTIRTNTPLI